MELRTVPLRGQWLTTASADQWAASELAARCRSMCGVLNGGRRRGKCGMRFKNPPGSPSVVLGTDHFPPCLGSAAVSDGRRPGHREDAFVFDSELQLQVLAPVIVVGRRTCIGAGRGPQILPCVPFQSFFRSFVIEQAIAFDHMQSLGIGRPVKVDHRERPNFDSDGVDHQRVAFIVADGILHTRTASSAPDEARSYERSEPGGRWDKGK